MTGLVGGPLLVGGLGRAAWAPLNPALLSTVSDRAFAVRVCGTLCSTRCSTAVVRTVSVWLPRASSVITVRSEMTVYYYYY